MVAWKPPGKDTQNECSLVGTRHSVSTLSALDDEVRSILFEDNAQHTHAREGMPPVSAHRGRAASLSPVRPSATSNAAAGNVLSVRADRAI